MVHISGQQVFCVVDLVVLGLHSLKAVGHVPHTGMQYTSNYHTSRALQKEELVNEDLNFNLYGSEHLRSQSTRAKI